MEFSPVRKVVHRGNVKRVGWFPSIKMGRPIAFESLLERDYFFLLEFDTDVRAFCEQPVQILYRHQGKNRKYYPDIAVDRMGLIQIIEVKPAKKVNDPKLLPKIDAGIHYCLAHDYEFRIVTNENICNTTLKNIKLLFGYNRIQVPASKKLFIREALGQRFALTIKELIDLLENKTVPASIALPYIYNQIYFHCIECDLSKPITKKSQIWLS